MRHLIDPLDFTQQEISTLLDLADRIHDDPAAYQDAASHKKLATLFYEPSTRTRLSFEAAMLNLGGHVLGFPSETVSSAISFTRGSGCSTAMSGFASPIFSLVST